MYADTNIKFWTKDKDNFSKAKFSKAKFASAKKSQ